MKASCDCRTPAAAHDIATNFDEIKKIIMAGLTDVWSAIRKSCASRLHGVDRNFKLEHLILIFRDCVAICKRPPNKSWQAKEGALLTITSIIRKFRIKFRDAVRVPARPSANLRTNLLSAWCLFVCA